MPADYQATPNVGYTYDDPAVPNSKGRLTRVTNGAGVVDTVEPDGAPIGRVDQKRLAFGSDGMAPDGCQTVEGPDVG